VDISAVVVSFNSEKFLRQNIASLLQQTVPFRRVIVVDNASGDGSRAVIGSFSGLEPLYLQDNIGYAAAANRGIAKAGSDLVLVANADIHLDPDFNRHVLEFFAAHPQAGMLSPLILRFDRETIDSAGQGRSLALYPLSGATIVRPPAPCSQRGRCSQSAAQRPCFPCPPWRS